VARQSFRKALLFGLETPAAMAACEVEPVHAMLVAVHPWDADGHTERDYPRHGSTEAVEGTRTTSCRRISRLPSLLHLADRLQ
jgi:hypothetical protein